MKSELAGILPARTCCQLSELIGIFNSSRGRLREGPLGTNACFTSLSNPVARKVVRLSRALGLEPRHQATRSARKTAFLVELPLPPHLRGTFTAQSERRLPDAPCDSKALLRGFFLGCGSVNAPSARYHLELVLPSARTSPWFLRLFAAHEVPAGTVDRAGHTVVYVKEAEGIARVLSLMAASRAVMELEKVRVLREVSGQVNRRLNFETANIEKSIDSALRQVAAIRRLTQSGRIDGLPPALREMAHLREAHPDLTMSELARRMRLSKSAVNHRLRRLARLVGNPEA